MDVAAQAEMLEGRVRKVHRHRKKWARREGIDCYRLYDRDIPEIPLAIDWYAGRLCVYRYARDWAEGDPRTDPGWPRRMAEAAASALGVAGEDLYLKERRRQRGDSQYEPLARTGRRFQVTELAHRFWVNLADYLDTGLFLDHRITRARVAAEAAGTRFLNLYCYTGAFTVYAAAAGARRSASVDLSNTYLGWAADNLALNEIDPARCELVRADVMPWLAAARDRGERFDLAVVDPPTFSTSKAMREASFDVQRDHAALLQATLAVIAPGGAVYFSTNRRRFTLDTAALGSADVEDITRATTPEDFRGHTPHRAWRISAAG